ncbi:unnamed protein product [Ranitomeya imitator]|uniref:Uncharacterized protein n=1 Tax=Ranitomeya imitator TaxID=111125 RepID=A0ABN9LXS9_9NEOB|nr:unnamed protein product [Ranitomeya imitator]
MHYSGYRHTETTLQRYDNDVDRCSVAVWSLESCHTDSSPATNDPEVPWVEEDLEKLLSLGMKTKNKPKPQIPAKPTFLKKSKNSTSPSHADIKPSEPNVQAMDESDILQYIKENEAPDSDSLSLF